MDKGVTAWQLFHEGHYMELKSDLEGKLKKCTDGLDRSLLLQNNVVVCKLMLADSVRCKGSLLPALERILQTCCSIPVNEDVLYTELATLYNYLHSGLICGKLAHSANTGHDKQYQAVNRTFYRLYKLVSVDGSDVRDLTSLPPRGCCLRLIDRCLSSLVYRYGAFQRPAMALCCCINMVCAVNIKDKTDVAWCLEKVQNILDSMKKTGTAEETEIGEGLMLPVYADHRDVVTSAQTVGDLAVYLQAVGMFQLECWSDCHQCLQRIKAADYKMVASFLSGWALYRNSQYLESVALLMETLRSQRPVTQRLKARIYNLIGMCFSELDKVQLAIQMYKEALSADFGYLLPLYKVSEQYRKQGNSDMELECLNLLVTAIDMREPSTSLVSGLDLLDLVDVDDSDIPYSKALYLLASRALSLNKYEAAAEKFTELIAYLKSWQADAQAFKSLPSLDQIYMESAQSLLKSDRFAECVSMCDTVLSANSCHGDILNASLTNDSSSIKFSFDQSVQSTNNNHEDRKSVLDEESQASSGTKKRKCSDSQGPREEAVIGKTRTEVTMLKVKAEALVKLGDKTGALGCLERASDSISRHRRALLQKHLLTEDQPASKRRKLDSASSVPKGGTNVETFEVECDIYTLTADILTSQGQHKEAEHYRRLTSELSAVSSRFKDK